MKKTIAAIGLAVLLGIISTAAFADVVDVTDQNAPVSKAVVALDSKSEARVETGNMSAIRIEVELPGSVAVESESYVRARNYIRSFVSSSSTIAP